MTDIEQYFSAPDPFHAAKLFIDLSALSQNYQKLCTHSGTSHCAAVVKANAYGLGVEQIAPRLWDQGCQSFFVAQPMEGEQLRRLLPKARIMVLNGVCDGAEDFFHTHNLIPVINRAEEAEHWARYSREKDDKMSAILHFDTGMNRLGIPASEAQAVLGNPTISESLEIICLMSHLACSDVPDHPKNDQQLRALKTLSQQYPTYKTSLANSGGIFLGSQYHQDLTRPGYALYGGKASALSEAEMTPVVHLRSKFLQIREVKQGESVGYGATWLAQRDSLIGILPLGYGDGFARLHGAPSGEIRGHVCVEGKKVPIIGRVSMDLMAVDITTLALSPKLRKMSVEILGPHITIDDLAESAQTIGYEVLTNLGTRYERHYGDTV